MLCAVGRALPANACGTVMPKRYEFTRKYRLSGRRAFSTVFAEKCSVADSHMVLYVRRNAVDHPRLGLSVGRKHGGAVRRNRIKRLLREAFRLTREQLPPGLDFVCVPRIRDDESLAAYMASLPKLARQAASRWSRHVPP